MQYDVQTPEEYLAALEPDWRRDTLLRVRELIRCAAPELAESIRYKMLSYGEGDAYVFGLNAQKHFVALYVGNIAQVDPDRTILRGVDQGKGCVRIRKSTDLGEAGVEAFVLAAADRWRRDEDIGC